MTEINIQGVDNINFVGRFTDITLDYEIKNSLPWQLFPEFNKGEIYQKQILWTFHPNIPNLLQLSGSSDDWIL